MKILITRIVPGCFFVLSTLFVYSRPDSIYLNIRVLTNLNLTHVMIEPVSGGYHIINSKGKDIEFQHKHHCNLAVKGKKVFVKLPSGKFESFDTLKIISKEKNAILKVRAGKTEKKYDDDLIIYIVNGQIRLINRVELEKYTASVVLSEGGDAKSAEFFRVQSLISRTYALKNIRKHENEGYQLCDQVHCQLYYGHINKTDILEALQPTRGLVILGPDTQLISAAFHSNSGGETTNSENVWSLPAPYLRGIPDTFSLAMPMATWEKKIPKKEWVHHLKTKYSFPVENKVMLDSALHFVQEHRKVFYVNRIPLKELRNDFKLRSTFFSIEDQGDILLIKGKGYGHGVGLSQEGAIRMAKDGFHYNDILKFYYQDIMISPVDTSLIPRKK